MNRVKRVITPLAKRCGFTETVLTPVNGREVHIYHSKINSYGYKFEKEITINPDVDLKNIRNSFYNQ